MDDVEQYPIEELSRWQLLLFFSADLVGSTEFKAKSAQVDPFKWVLPFHSFYTTFPRKFKDNFNIYAVTYIKENCYRESLRVWKLQGDEVLMTVKIDDSRLVPFYVEAFRKTIRDISHERQTLAEMQCKGTVWSAGFPVRNWIITIDSSKTVDYIGPSIDCGFRLTKYSTPRKLITADGTEVP